MRQVRGDQGQVNWTRKAPYVNAKKSQLPSRSNSNCPSPKQSEYCYCGAIPGHPKEKCRAVILKYVCGRRGKEGHIARKCLGKLQNVNALDESLSDDGQETYDLFPLETHSARNVSVQKGKKKVFALIKLSAEEKKNCVEETAT